MVEVSDADGLTVALARAPALVITDYQLRFSDGLALLRQVKGLWPEVPVIMYTGTGSEQEIAPTSVANTRVSVRCTRRAGYYRRPRNDAPARGTMAVTRRRH